MASELEGLIAALLVLISCGGEQGSSVSEVVDAIHDPSKTQHTTFDQTEYDAQILKDVSGFRHRTASTIWKWLAARRDVSVGLDRKYNHLTLDEVLALAPHSPLDHETNGNDATSSEVNSGAHKRAHYVRVSVSEETMWESLTGHAVDYKRVPRSEWLLLLGIASTTSQGILQGDLGRLVDQDKRSVPKRTDALLKKGYIAKRTTLVRGTKTSKMWLKMFAPPLPKDGDTIDEPRAEMNFTRQVLVANRDPVPWHIRWTGESVDYTALATTILAVAKEWGVLRMQDLKSKLGVLGMRWQMKVLAKVCRFLNSRGVIQYVAAKLGDKVFKDCIKYVRDLNNEDWSIYLATGKRTTKPSRNPDLAAGEGADGKSLYGQQTNASEISSAPPWSLDKPLPVTIAEMAQRLGDTGLSNPDVYGLTLGPSFSRYLSSMTSALATPNLQPLQLKHFQLRSEHTRAGKIASYRYFAQQAVTVMSGEMNASEAPCDRVSEESNSSRSLSYGFSPAAKSSMTTTQGATFTELCSTGSSVKKSKGRPKKKRAVKPVDPAPVAAKARAKQDQKSSHNTGSLNDGTSQRGNSIPQENAVPPYRTPQESPSTPEEHSEKRLIVTLKATPQSLQNLLQSPAAGSPTRPKRSRTRRSMVVDDDVQENSIVTAEDVSTVHDTPTISKKRGRPRRGTKPGQNAEDTPAARPFKCEKCGGSWKNDIGLKYHLEKSRTPCNPSFDESAQPTPRRYKKRATSEENDTATSAPAVPLTPQTEKPGSGRDPEQEEDSEQESTPAPSRLSKRVAAPPTMSSRPSVSLTGGPLQAIPEWRRPPVAGFGSPDKIPMSNANDGALVQSQDGQLRPALGLSDYRKPGSGTPKVAQNKQYEESAKPSMGMTQSEIPGPNDEAGGECLAVQPLGEKQAASTVVDSLLPKVTSSSRISEIIMELLEEQMGVFPGGRGLWHAITVRWEETFQTEEAPTSKASQSALRELVRSKIVAEHWHAFRDNKGIFCKCQTIVLGTHDPFSEEATSLVDRIKQSHPDTYLPPPFTTLPATELMKEGRRGRRQLGDEVEILDAPVYAAQVAAKRASNENDEEYSASRSKRRKTKTMDTSLSPGSPGKRGHVSWAGIDHSDYIPQPEWSGPSEYLLNQKPIEGIEFLAPNTFLQELPPSKSYKRRRLSKDPDNDDCVIDPRLMLEDTTVRMTFDKALPVVGTDGTWPYISSLDFEGRDASYALHGWMPDLTWFSWAEIVEEIERRTALLSGLKRQPRTSSGQYYRFRDRLSACIDVERMWTDSFINALPNATGPHNIFIRFFMGRGSPMMLPSVPITWPLDWQLTSGSFKLLVEGDEAAEYSASSEDEDSFTWPILRRRLVDIAKTQTVADEYSTRQDPGARNSIKRVQLVTRALTALPPVREKLNVVRNKNPADETVADPDRVLAAFIAVRVLLGGADKAIDWGLLLKIFPKTGLTQLRRFWLSTRKEQGAFIAKLTKDFQDKFLVAYENDELPELDFNDLNDYDWNEIIAWTLRLRRRAGIRLPSTRDELAERFSSQEMVSHDEDWREKFFHPQTSVFSRFEASTAMPAAVSLDEIDNRCQDPAKIKDLDIARSWIRSLCCTDETRYSPHLIKEKFSTLANGDPGQNNKLLKQAIDELTHQRVICRSKKPPLGGRPYRLNESYTYTLGKLAQQQKYQEAAVFKDKLDVVFRRGKTMKVPFTLDDGSVMALTNLNASERIKLVPVNVPQIPMGFEPGNYESRKYPKSYYHFGIEAVPTELYQYNDDIDVLKLATEEGPPSEGPRGELPQWIDFFGQRDLERWAHVLGAFCFIYATRGLMTIEGICSALKPVLEGFEARMIISWGKETGVLKDSDDGAGITVGEWWWLAVPWQLRGMAVDKES